MTILSMTRQDSLGIHDLLNVNVIGAPFGRSASIVIAPSNAPSLDYAQADYQLPGTDDGPTLRTIFEYAIANKIQNIKICQGTVKIKSFENQETVGPETWWAGVPFPNKYADGTSVYLRIEGSGGRSWPNNAVQSNGTIFYIYADAYSSNAVINVATSGIAMFYTPLGAGSSGHVMDGNTIILTDFSIVYQDQNFCSNVSYVQGINNKHGNSFCYERLFFNGKDGVIGTVPPDALPSSKMLGILTSTADNFLQNYAVIRDVSVVYFYTGYELDIDCLEFTHNFVGYAYRAIFVNPANTISTYHHIADFINYETPHGIVYNKTGLYKANIENYFVCINSNSGTIFGPYAGSTDNGNKMRGTVTWEIYNSYNSTIYPFWASGNGGNTVTKRLTNISTGEIRTYTATITSAADHHGAIISSIDNPFYQAVEVLDIEVKLTTQAGAAATLDVGVGSSATADYSTMIAALPLNPGTSYPYYYSATKTATYGQMAAITGIYWASGSGNRYLNFFNPSAASDNGAVWTYTVTVRG